MNKETLKGTRPFRENWASRICRFEVLCDIADIRENGWIVSRTQGVNNDGECVDRPIVAPNRSGRCPYRTEGRLNVGELNPHGTIGQSLVVEN